MLSSAELVVGVGSVLVKRVPTTLLRNSYDHADFGHLRGACHAHHSGPIAVERSHPATAAALASSTTAHLAAKLHGLFFLPDDATSSCALIAGMKAGSVSARPARTAVAALACGEGAASGTGAVACSRSTDGLGGVDTTGEALERSSDEDGLVAIH